MKDAAALQINWNRPAGGCKGCSQEDIYGSLKYGNEWCWTQGSGMADVEEAAFSGLASAIGRVPPRELVKYREIH